MAATILIAMAGTNARVAGAELEGVSADYAVRAELSTMLSNAERRSVERNPVYYKYEVKEFLSAGYLYNKYKDSRPGYEFRDLIYTVTVEKARKGDRRYAAHWAPLVNAGVLKKQAEPDVFVYDGKVMTAFMNQLAQGTDQSPRRPIYSVSKDPNNGQGFVDAYDLAGEATLLYVLRTGVGSDPNTEVDVSLHDEGDLVRLVATIEYQGNRALYRFLLNPGKGFVPNSGSVTYAFNNAEVKHRNIVWEMRDGHQVPVSATREEFAHGKELQKRQELSLISFTTDVKQIPDSLFQIKVPDNAVIEDWDLGITIRDPNFVQSHLDQIRGGQWPTKWIWALVNAVMVACLVGWLLWRRSATRRQLLQ